MQTTINQITADDSIFPTLLKEIPGVPKKLFYIGDGNAWKIPLIAIVGTRKASYEGRELAKRIASEISGYGVGIVSGLALGVDCAAHEGALIKNGITIAVLANGLDTIYPRQHEKIAEKILSTGGAIISEYPSGSPALPHQFLERNRIISGLALATIVIEAPKRSGSIATARNAMEQGREVFIFPGPSNHQNYRGSHELIRAGARLVSSFEDIKEDLSSLFEKYDNSFEVSEEGDIKIPEKYGDDAKKVLRAIQNIGGIASTDEIISSSGLEAPNALSTIALLVIEGILEEQNGKFCIIRKRMI